MAEYPGQVGHGAPKYGQAFGYVRALLQEYPDFRLRILDHLFEIVGIWNSIPPNVEV
jgi:hypothetical protein